MFPTFLRTCTTFSDFHRINHFFHLHSQIGWEHPPHSWSPGNSWLPTFPATQEDAKADGEREICLWVRRALRCEPQRRMREGESPTHSRVKRKPYPAGSDEAKRSASRAGRKPESGQAKRKLSWFFCGLDRSRRKPRTGELGAQAHGFHAEGSGRQRQVRRNMAQAVRRGTQSARKRRNSETHPLARRTMEVRRKF